jgi:hypothetical protein
MHPVEFRTEDGKVLLDKGVMARLRFETETESDIPGCKAAITSIEKNGQTVVSGVRLPLLFNPAHDPNSDTKTIKYGQPEYLEVIWMSESGETEIKTKTNFPYAFTKYQKLDRSATYSLHVAVSTPDITPEPVILRAECKNGAWMLSIIRAAVGTA